MTKEEIEKKALELYPEKLVNSAKLCSVNPPIYFNEQVDSNAPLREAYIKCWKDNFANQPQLRGEEYTIVTEREVYEGLKFIGWSGQTLAICVYPPKGFKEGDKVIVQIKKAE